MCDCVGVSVIVWVGVVVIAWVRECVGGTALIAAVKYVCVWGGQGEKEEGVCGWDSLDCCCKVCVGGEGEGKGSVTVWV